MYVCLCHGLTDRDIKEAACEAGCEDGGTLGDLYRALDVRPCCAKCVPMVRDIARPHRAARTTSRPGALTVDPTPA